MNHDMYPCHQDATVRAETLDALCKLYKDEEISETIQKFTERFLERYAEMTGDCDVNVTVKAIEVHRLLSYCF